MPEANGGVDAARSHRFAVRRKGNEMNFSLMSPEFADDTSRGNIPEVDAVGASLCQNPAVWGKRQAIGMTGLLVKIRRRLQGREFPEPHDRAVAADGEPSAVGRHGHQFSSVVRCNELM